MHIAVYNILTNRGSSFEKHFFGLAPTAYVMTILLRINDVMLKEAPRDHTNGVYMSLANCQVMVANIVKLSHLAGYK